MTTAMHTPGPWAETGWSATGPTAAADYVAIEAVKANTPEVFTRPVVQALGVGKAVVCTAYGMSEDEVRANARLIAAVPKLLGALLYVKEAMIAFDETRSHLYSEVTEALAAAGAP